MSNIDYRAYDELDYREFERRAGDDSLSKYQKIGFPDSYRRGFEEAIFADILCKLPPLVETEKRVLDIGPGCSDLPRLLIDHCRQYRHHLTLVDSKAMLDLLPDEDHVEKVPGYFPSDELTLEALTGSLDVVLCYSVFQYIFADGHGDRFLDRAGELLCPGGCLLIGDMPNVSKRARFFRSERGIAFHKAFMKTDEPPDVGDNPPAGSIDDEVVVALLARARAAGLDAYVVPQAENLPMANRREDILIHKP
ncbi:MAG: class I SAM-dependent methyltransferase [Acidobacteriota bacterium]|nr:class I SAM-dependent methyltransferase [Acidobacteriota bacterium]